MSAASDTQRAHHATGAYLKHFLLFFLLLTSTAAFAQQGGTVAGIVVSTWDGTPLPGVIVTVRGTTLATQTDATGRYELKNVPIGDQVLRFSKSAYASAVVTDVRVLLGQTTTVNGNLRPEFFEMEEYEVTAEEFTEQTEQIIFERQQASAMMDAIGADQFSKVGAGDAAEALSKVSGASVAGGKFAVIRGLADRYTFTTFNGVDIPSADPDRKAAQLDLFPSKFISRIDVSKTFAPDMAGGFAGGLINIVPRSFPDKFEFEMEAGLGYNTQASLKDDFPMSDHGATDWLAIDDGTRALPGVAAATSPRSDAGTLDPAIKDSFGSRQFGPIPGDSLLNSSYFLGIGNSQKLWGGRLGYLGGLTYKNSYEFYGDDARALAYTDLAGANPVVDRTNRQGVIEYTWSAMVTLGYEINEHHNLGFNFMFVQSAEDKATRLQGKHPVIEEGGSGYLDQSILKWTERNLQYYQINGGHEFPALRDIRVDWAGAISTTTQDEPDTRIIQFVADPENRLFNPEGTVEPTRPFRNWRFLQEDNTSGRVDFTIPVPSYNSKENIFKTGLAYSLSERNLEQRAFSVVTVGGINGHPFWRTGDVNSYLAQSNQQFTAYQNYSQAYRYIGEQTIAAGYLMGDWHALEWLRFAGGVRHEHTDLTVDTLNLAQGGTRSASAIKRDDLLPSASTTISIRENLLLRAAWSETVIRPTYREISRAFEVDAVRGRLFNGNPFLTFSTSQNYDLRLEWYPRPGSLLALSGFMKEITGPIEKTATGTDNVNTTFTNFPSADVKGVEFEFRENLGSWWKPLEELTLGFNAAYIQSEVPLTPEQRSIRGSVWRDTATTRPLFDQPEYIMNGDITWDHKSTGTRFTVSGGVVGRRLVLVGLAEPDDFEEPAPQLDVFLTQKLGKHWKMKFSAKNLLDPVYEVSQEWPVGRLPVETYTKGMTFGLALGCEF